MHAAFQPCSCNLISVANSDAGLGKAALWLDANAPTVGAAQLVFTCSERHPSVFILNEILESLSKSVLKHLFKIESYFHSLRLVIFCYSSIALYFIVLLLLSLFFNWMSNASKVMLLPQPCATYSLLREPPLVFGYLYLHVICATAVYLRVYVLRGRGQPKNKTMSSYNAIVCWKKKSPS